MTKTINVTESDTTLFTNICVETTSWCNRACVFCPQGHTPRAEELMPRETFDRIIEQLVELKYARRVMIFDINEPMSDPRLPELIAHTRARLPKCWIAFATNGDYVKTADDLRKYFDAGLNGMQINVYSSADGSGDADKIAKSVERAKKRYAKLQSLVRELGDEVVQKGVYQQGRANERRCVVVRKWDIQPENAKIHGKDVVVVRHGGSKVDNMTNRAGAVPGFMPEMSGSLSATCTRPFRTLMINWKGDVHLCCSDYHGEVVFGNVMGDRSLVELWNDARLHDYRVKLQNRIRSDLYLCNGCDYFGGFYTGAITHVTRGDLEDARVILRDMSTLEKAIGAGQLVNIRTR